MDFSQFSSLAWLVAAQLLLYAIGWGVLSLIVRRERAAIAHWSLFLLLMGLGFQLASGRNEAREWLPYVGSNLAFVTGWVALRRGLTLFMRVPVPDGELLAVACLAWLALLVAGPDAASAPARVVITYGIGGWMMARAMLGVRRATLQEFGLLPMVVTAAPALVLVAGFGSRIVHQALDWSHPLEMQAVSGSNQRLLIVYLVGAAMFNFSFMALVTLRLVRSLREQARNDPLTGLPNRRALEQDLQAAWQRFRSGAGGFAVLALDLDHFKRVNDAHGHLAGDAVLEQLGQRLRTTARQHDIVARTGGEEFVVLMPGTTADNARALAQRLIDAVRARPFELPGHTLPLTVSVGVAHAMAGDDAALRVMQRADEALYQAKASGRNCLATAPVSGVAAAAA